MLYKKYDINIDDYDFYDSDAGCFRFISCCYDGKSVNIDYTRYFGSCGAEGFQDTISDKDLESFDIVKFEATIKNKKIEQLLYQHKALMAEAEKVAKQLRDLQ